MTNRAGSRGLVAEERELVECILTLAGELEAVTIERLIAKTDLEIGMQAMLGPHSGWGVPDQDEVGQLRSPSMARRGPGRG